MASGREIQGRARAAVRVERERYAAGPSNEVPVPVSALESATSDVNGAVARLNELAGRVAVIGGRLFGETGDDSGKAAEKDTASGTYGRLRLRIADLDCAITALEAQILRIEQI